jgi:DNA repair ATPase RecN
MSEVSEKVSEAIEQGGDPHLNNAVAVLVAITATFMALCNVKDGNIVQAMTQAQTQSVDEWAYYQAKSTKQFIAESFVDQLNIQYETLPGMTPEARAHLKTKIATYTEQAKKYETEKKELAAKAEGLQKEYDRLNVHDDQFDMAEAGLSIAIALYGITALTRKRWLLAFAGLLTACGCILGLAGFAGWNIHPDFLAKLLS